MVSRRRKMVAVLGTALLPAVLLSVAARSASTTKSADSATLIRSDGTVVELTGTGQPVQSTEAAAAAATIATPPSAPAGGSLLQRVVVPVLPGDLQLQADSATVQMIPGSDGMLHGQLGPVQVVDARGSLVGWRLDAALTDLAVGGQHIALDDVRVRISPAAPTVVAGEPAGLEAARVTLDDRTAAVCSATNGHGGGTYLCSATIDADIQIAPGVDASLTVALSLR